MIALKTDVKGCKVLYQSQPAWQHELHDALVAHALVQAIEERIAQYEADRAYQGDVLTNAAIKSLNQLQHRAAELLAQWGMK